MLPSRGHHEVEIGILGHHLGDVAVVFHDDVDFAGKQQVLALVVVEDFHVGLLADVHLRHLIDDRQRDVAHRVAQILGAQLDQVVGLRKEADPTLVAVAESITHFQLSGTPCILDLR